ncbi:hypothetical protein HNQ56_001376 [Anaerotaenia torta]|uniref:hypothetical protein n=1 Tax=Anaerotaenia torta TaxID=433293 RepID=UPI003D227AC1
MKNYDYWKNFIKTGRIDDYLHYIACTKEEIAEEPHMDFEKEGGLIAGVQHGDRNGSVDHADWGMR